MNRRGFLASLLGAVLAPKAVAAAIKKEPTPDPWGSVDPNSRINWTREHCVWTDLEVDLNGPRIIFVSPYGGDDANDGRSEWTPKASVEAGWNLMRDGHPDWLVLRSGPRRRSKRKRKAIVRRPQ